MAGNISEFKSSFTKDLARPNKFQVNIPVPLTLIPYVNNAKNLVYRCENANLPGRMFATTEQKIGSNPVEKYPYLTTYNDLALTFIVDDDMNQKVFFDAWMNFINPTYNYNFRYKGDYATVITINQYDVTNKVSYSINLYDAYPVSLEALDLDWAMDGYHKLRVTFAYTYWQNNSIQAYGMQLVDAGLAYVSDVIGGLGGSAIGALGQAGNVLPNVLQNANVARDPDQPLPDNFPVENNEWQGSTGAGA
jgi:hypothetical protein